MKLRLLLFLPLLLLFAEPAIAGPGDTLVVQTFTWEWPVNPGWGAPKEGWFQFPEGGKQYEKILMYYTLKCDPTQNPACGEWDYLTYTRLREHTGVMDSTQATHPNFLVNGSTPDTLGYRTTPGWTFVPRKERRIVYDDTTSLTTAAVGSGSLELESVLGGGNPDSRTYMLWTSEELDDAGVVKDNITAMRFHATASSGGMHRLTVRLRRYTEDGWNNNIPMRDIGWLTVYDGAFEAVPDSWNTIHFLQPFSYWSGDILAEVTIDRIDGEGCTLTASDIGEDRTFTANAEDGLLYFDRFDHVNCGPMAELNDTQAFTLEAWLKADVLRNWSNVMIKGTDSKSRVGIQLNAPESGNSDVFCLVGDGANSYGRTNTRPIAQGEWIHISMVYDGTVNTQEGRLKLYLNGEEQTLTFNNTIPAFTAVNDDDMTISSFKGEALTGSIDEVRIWDIPLTSEQVGERAFRHLESTDPLFGNLIAYYNFNDGSGMTAADQTGKHPGRLLVPQWRSSMGDRVKQFTASTLRPDVVFEQGSFTTHVEETFIIDTMQQKQMMVILYEDTTNANVATDTLFVWSPYYMYTFAPDGSVADSQFVAADEWLYRADHFYYQSPFEIVNRYELGRYITPYGIGLDLGDGWTWVYDVTDFAPLLKDSVHLTAGNFQELLDMKFMFIEGTPPRDVLKVENLWQGTFALKNFETLVPPKTVDLDETGKMWKLRTSATGHDFSNATNCAEFCPKIHSVDVNGSLKWSWQIIQECSTNPLYPQGGTWIYDRAGWCPGMEATVEEFEITPFISGAQVELDYNSQYDEFGRYVFESQLVTYGDFNHQVDAAIDNIIAPSNDNLNNRFNPICGQPRIVLKNLGAQDLTSATIRYGLRGGESNNYQWTGNLEFSETETLVLPALDWGEMTAPGIFDVKIMDANGGADEYVYNNSQFSSFEPVPVFDAQLIVRFKTNNVPSENRWEVRDRDGRVVYSKTSFAANRTYYDTLDFAPGCYEIILYDSGDDGISWWANNDGTGSFQFRLVGGGLWASVNPDFGRSARYPFRYSNLVAVEELPTAADGFELYPNPANDRLSLSYDLAGSASLHYEVYNMLGEKMLHGASQDVHAATYRADVSTSELQPGVYVITILDGSRVLTRSTFSVVR